MYTEARSVLRAVVMDLFLNCWCLEIPSDNRIRHLPRCGYNRAQYSRLEAFSDVYVWCGSRTPQMYEEVYKSTFHWGGLLLISGPLSRYFVESLLPIDNSPKSPPCARQMPAGVHPCNLLPRHICDPSLRTNTARARIGLISAGGSQYWTECRSLCLPAFAGMD
jgi:hypothetical protein